jgi:hypothetical protein
MLKTIGKAIGLVLGGLIVLGVALYFAGVRIVVDGGGTPSLAFVDSPDERADVIARHREAQRSQGPPPPAPAPPPPPAPGTGAAGDPPVPVDPAVPTRPSADPAPTVPYWTDFRGPARDGHYRERPIRTDWTAGGLTPLWKQPVGAGYASFVAAQGRAFTIEQRPGGGGRVRRGDRPRALDERLVRSVPRDDGRRRPARHPDLA